MKQLINKLLSSNKVSALDLTTFIERYTTDLNRKVTSQELPLIVQLFSLGVFDLHTAIKNACIHYQYNLYELFDKNGKRIKIWIE